MTIFVLQTLKNLNASYNGVLTREGLRRVLNIVRAGVAKIS